MFMLILNFGDGDVSVELPVDGGISFGRSEDTDVYIDHPDVEARHAEISADQDGGCWIRDLNSSRGTFVNGRRVGFQKLAPGDELMFGLVVVHFVNLQAPPDSPHSVSDAKPTMESAPVPDRPEPSAEKTAHAAQTESMTAPSAVIQDVATKVTADVPSPAAEESEPPPQPVAAAKSTVDSAPVPDRPEPSAEKTTQAAQTESLAAPAAVIQEVVTQTAAGIPSPAAEQSGPILSPEIKSSQSRSTHPLKLFFLLAFANTALFVACASWLIFKTENDLKREIASLALAPPPAIQVMPAIPAVSDATATRLTVDAEEMKKKITALQAALEDAQKKISESGDKTDETARLLAGFTSQLEELKNTAAKSDAPAPPPILETSLPASRAELVLLKERNRLTAYADEAIATGARVPYERLWEAIEDPRLANLVHAARTEILRVQDCYINGQRVKFHGIQHHQIPVAEIFPESAALTPAQLGDDQLIQVLQDLKQSWQTRVKAAWQLGQRRNTRVGDALVKAIKTDPVLDVVAEATFSFEQITGYRAKLFEIQPIEAWWKSQNEKPTASKTDLKKSDDTEADGKTKPE